MTQSHEMVRRPGAATAVVPIEAPSGAHPARSRPGRSTFLRACAVRSSTELKTFFRNKQSVVFTLTLPVLLMVILASVFSGNVDGTNVSFRRMLIAGVLASGVMSVAFSGLAISIAIERDDGTIRRLANSPMPKTAYFVGKLVRVVVPVLLESAVLLAIAVTAFGMPLPRTADRWLTLAWVLVLGTVACALLALAYSTVIPNGRAAPAVVTPPFLVLQFISGIFFPFGQLPAWMQSLAAVFPLKWMAQGFRSVFLPDSFTRAEMAGAWEHGRTAVVLAAWCVGALAVALGTFRWRGPRVG